MSLGGTNVSLENDTLSMLAIQMAAFIICWLFRLREAATFAVYWAPIWK
jgi:hypothetical protein